MRHPAMPNCDFYAVGEDLEKVLEYVFSEVECRVFESYSPCDQKLAEFTKVSEIAARYPLGKCKTTESSVNLELWPTRASKQVRVKKIRLDPKRSKGAKYRFTIEGWGLIQLHLGGESKLGIISSHTNHFTEKGARKWESMTGTFFHRVSAWDWKEVSRLSSQINRHIRQKLAVDKIGSRPVLPEAAELIIKGVDVV